jgi:predicted nucleotidyltransferase
MWKANYDSLAIEGLREPLVHISDTCKELGIDFFIVGAIARNIWLVFHDENPSGTKDIDLGVYVPDEKKYNELRDSLLSKYDYTPSRENPFCLISPDGKLIDLLPFGEIENAGHVMIEGRGLTSINLDGFREVFKLGVVEVMIGADTYKACSIPGIVILKMIAFDDRPDRRIKDIGDIYSICRHYPQIVTDHIWNAHADLYADESLEHADVAMIVLGREMEKLIAANQKLKDRIDAILDRGISEESRFLFYMIEDPNQETLGMKRRILKHIKMGLKGELYK